MDKWNILLEKADNDFTVATVLEVPDIQATDKSKQGAVDKVRQLLQQRLAQAEIVQIRVYPEFSDKKNQLMKFAGIFQNDSDFEDIMNELRAEREDNTQL